MLKERIIGFYFFVWMEYSSAGIETKFSYSFLVYKTDGQNKIYFGILKRWEKSHFPLFRFIFFQRFKHREKSHSLWTLPNDSKHREKSYFQSRVDFFQRFCNVRKSHIFYCLGLLFLNIFKTWWKLILPALCRVNSWSSLSDCRDNLT